MYVEGGRVTGCVCRGRESNGVCIEGGRVTGCVCRGRESNGVCM